MMEVNWKLYLPLMIVFLIIIFGVWYSATREPETRTIVINSTKYEAAACEELNGLCTADGKGYFSQCVGQVPNCSCSITLCGENETCEQGSCIPAGNETPSNETNVSCEDFDIGAEYFAHFGSATMNTARTNCELNGTWTQTSSELSCIASAPVELNCSSEFHVESQRFCTEDLHAIAVCDNETGIYGCFCHEGDVPQTPAWYCGEFWNFEDQTGVCSGTCDEGTCGRIMVDPDVYDCGCVVD